MNFSRIFGAVGYVIAVTVFLGFGYLVANGGWWIPNPLSTPPDNSGIPQPITTGSVGQFKAAPLTLNFDQVSPIGLWVYGSSTPSGCTGGAGCVGVGTNNPAEKLHVAGNINIFGVTGNQTVRGLLKPDWEQGAWSHTITAAGPDDTVWYPDNAWMSIQRIDINAPGGCFSLFPLCPAGWQEYETKVFNSSCTAAGSWTYGNAVRTCFQQIQS